MKLDGKVALVTGASRGIGRSVAIELASHGALVYVNYSASDEKALETVKEIEKLGGKGKAVKFSVENFDLVDKSIKMIIASEGKIDILVNNAGIARDNLLMRMKEADFDRIINVNLKGVFNCTKSVVRGMIKQKQGRIINISSVVGEMGNAGQSVYSASKAGIIGFTKSCARELAPRGITANAVAPGFILTDMTEMLSEEVRESYLKDIPIGRFGEANDIAWIVSFLCSEKSSYITGQVFRVNGGMYM